MITGALILLLGILIGWVLRSLPGGKRRAIAQPTTECGCRHHLSMHDPVTTACHGQIKQVKEWWQGEAMKYEFVRCTCRQYVGPEPLVTFVSPELPAEGVAKMIPPEETQR